MFGFSSNSSTTLVSHLPHVQRFGVCSCSQCRPWKENGMGLKPYHAPNSWDMLFSSPIFWVECHWVALEVGVDGYLIHCVLWLKEDPDLNPSTSYPTSHKHLVPILHRTWYFTVVNKWEHWCSKGECYLLSCEQQVVTCERWRWVTIW